MIRKNKRNEEELVILDHGLYIELDDEFRYNYALLWKGILEQNEENMKAAAISLGAEKDYKLFSSMITAKPFD